MTAHALPGTAAEATIARQFEALKALALRRAARRRSSASPPRACRRRRVESWHYTDLRAAMSDAAPLAPAPDRAAIEAARALLARHEKAGAARLVTVNGRFAPELSDALPAGAQASRAAKRGARTPRARWRRWSKRCRPKR